MAERKIEAFKSELDLKSFLANNYMRQINNFFGDEKKALKFLSAVMADVQRNPELLECTPMSVINSYLTMAELGFMPSSVSGESYVLPYNNSKQIGGKWVKVKEAQFQMGYQGLVTLFYTAGIERVTSDIVRKNDKTTYINGKLTHEVDLGLSSEERGEPVGAYVIVTFKGADNVRYMNAKDILAHGKRFSKSYDPEGKYTPWNPLNDPELHMWRKTVLKQLAKYVPKNENINKAIALDNRDSRISDAPKMVEASNLQMGNFLKENDKPEKTKKESAKKSEDSQEPADTDVSIEQGQ